MMLFGMTSKTRGHELKHLGIALVRTSIVPPVGGFATLNMVSLFWDIDAHSRTGNYFIYMLASGMYYFLFHCLEIIPRSYTVRKLAGFFLGFPRQVIYVKESKDAIR